MSLVQRQDMMFIRMSDVTVGAKEMGMNMLISKGKRRTNLFSKRVRKLVCGCGRQLVFLSVLLDFSLLQMLAGEIESIPGPKSSQFVGSGKMEGALECLEVDQTSIFDALKAIVDYLEEFEEELVKVKRR